MSDDVKKDIPPGEEPDAQVPMGAPGDLDEIAAIRAEAERLAKEEAELLPKEEKKPLAITHPFVVECAKAKGKGAGMLFAVMFRERFICTPVGKIPWYEWQGHYWKRVYSPVVRAAVEEVAQKYSVAIFEELSRMRELDPEDDARKDSKQNIKALRSSINSLHGSGGVSECLSFSLDNTDPLLVDPDELDKKPYKLGCSNGILELRTGELHPGKQSDFITRVSPFPWTGKDTPCPRWRQMLLDIFGSPEVARYFQKLIGYAAGGRITEKLFIILLGEDGDSGKTTIFEILFDVLGPYAEPMPVEYLLDQGGSPRNPDAPAPVLLSMRGTRMTWASEPGEGRRFSVDRIKLMSGNDRLSARGPYDVEATTFEPTHTLFLLTNHKMRAAASDTAFWGRVRLLECPYSFVENPVGPAQKKRDPTLKDTIVETEGSGVLAWIAEGHRLYQAEGLAPPQAVIDATSKYKVEEDVIAEFLETCTEAAPDAQVSVDDMYTTFRNWHKPNHGARNIPTKIGFGKYALKFKGMRKDKIGGEQRWLDIKIEYVAEQKYLKA